MHILKSTWADCEEPPPYARAALDRGWIVLAQYLQIPMVPCPSLTELLYDKNPLFGLLKKEPLP